MFAIYKYILNYYKNDNLYLWRVNLNKDDNKLGLLSENHDVDIVIDFDGIGAIEALAKAQAAILEHINKPTEKIWFKFSLSQDGSPTIFAPIGNWCREKIKSGEVIRAMPSSEGGWIIRIK